MIFDPTVAHGATINNVIIDTFDIQNRFKLMIRDKGGMNHNATVIDMPYLFVKSSVALNLS